MKREKQLRECILWLKEKLCIAIEKVRKEPCVSNIAHKNRVSMLLAYKIKLFREERKRKRISKSS